jgi:hypothetical protein
MAGCGIIGTGAGRSDPNAALLMTEPGGVPRELQT